MKDWGRGRPAGLSNSPASADVDAFSRERSGRRSMALQEATRQRAATQPRLHPDLDVSTKDLGRSRCARAGGLIDKEAKKNYNIIIIYVYVYV